jgi:hypothetical protein
MMNKAGKADERHGVRRCDKDRGVGIEMYMIQIRLRSSSRGENIVG